MRYHRYKQTSKFLCEETSKPSFSVFLKLELRIKIRSNHHFQKMATKQFISFLIVFGFVAFVQSDTIVNSSQPELNSTLLEVAKEPEWSELVSAKLPSVLKKHQMSSSSKLVDLKPALANVTKFDTCYEKGIVGKDTTLNIFDNMTVEANVNYYFVSFIF